MFNLERLFPDIACFLQTALYHILSSHPASDAVTLLAAEWKKTAPTFAMFSAFLGSNSSEPTVAVSQGGGDMLLLRFQKYLGDDWKNPYHFEGRV